MVLGDYRSDLTLAQLVEVGFDAVVFNDVLEHLERPDLALAATINLLDVHGIILCSLPNVRYLPVLLEIVFRRDFRYKQSGILDFTHLRFFTFRSAQRLVENSGFQIISTNGINGIAGSRVPGGIRRLVEKLGRLVPQCLFPQVAIVAQPAVPNVKPHWDPR